MTDPVDQPTKKSGELTFKQAGIMLLVVAVILGALTWASSHGILTSTPGAREKWSWGGVPVEVIAVVFGVAGIALTIVGIVKKS
jgi:hypothetical protein